MANRNSKGRRNSGAAGKTEAAKRGGQNSSGNQYTDNDMSGSSSA